jgi:5-methylcytosine-specific restriction protein A
VSKGRCDQHRRDHHLVDRLARGSAHRRGYDADHRRWREEVLARDPVCKLCDRRPSLIADHIRPLDPADPHGDPSKWALSNGQGVCRPCHNIKTARERRGAGQFRQNEAAWDRLGHAHATPRNSQGGA